MKIQINSDKQVVVDAARASKVESVVQRVLGRFESDLTRIEVHLSDVNSHKLGIRDQRCEIEARPAGRKPVSVSDNAATVMQSVRRAANKMKRLLETSFGKTPYRISRRSPNQANKPAAQVQNPKELRGKSRQSLGAPAPATGKNAPRTDGEGRSTPVSAKKVTSSRRPPKKKLIYQARRKRWPSC